MAGQHAGPTTRPRVFRRVPFRSTLRAMMAGDSAAPERRRTSTPSRASAPIAVVSRVAPNRWDLFVLPLLLAVVLVIVHGARELAQPLEAVSEAPISLAPSALPRYALLTTIRMFVAMAASLVFTFVYATAAAKSRRLEKVLIPALDILQSVPVLGYLSFAVVFLLDVFPGKTIGVEIAAVFAIFTSQAWNMAFSFYQSLRTVPADLDEATRAFRFTAWQRFWRLDAPFAVPGLVWNMMMSMSGGWFFVVASEAITVGGRDILLPGVGSYVAAAILARDLPAIASAVVCMIVVIGIYDQLVFRPLVAWSAKFHAEEVEAATAPRSWLLLVFQRTRAFRWAAAHVGGAATDLLKVGAPRRESGEARPAWRAALGAALWYGALTATLGASLWAIFLYVRTGVGWPDLGEALLLGLFTLIRVVSLVLIASIVWVPIGVHIGLRPRLAEKVQPLIQFLAAFPANLLFPFAVLGILHFQLDPGVWLSPLMILGTQWYILFNVIAGTMAFPADLRQAADNLGVRGLHWWIRVMLPGIFPYYVTGAITASGGSWNASIVAEIARWGDTTLTARGLGAYIQEVTDAGDYPRIVLGILVMSAYVTALNRLLWRPMYAFAEKRLRIG